MRPGLQRLSTQAVRPLRWLREPELLRPLHHRDFRLLWMGQTVSSFGNFVYIVAAPFQILALGGTPIQLGAMLAITMAVRLTFLLVGGAVVDRMPRRTVILTADLSRGLVVLAVAIAGVAGALRIEHLYMLALFFGVAQAFSLPAMRAIVPDLVPDDILIQGNALQSLSRQIGRLTGPVFGGVVIAAFGPPLGFIIDALTFFVSFLALRAARHVTGRAPARRNLLTQVREGLAYTLSMRWLVVTVLITAVTNATMLGPLIVGLPVLVRDDLLGDARVFGLISMALGAGELAGTVIVSQARPASTGIVYNAFIASGGLAVAGMGAVPAVPAVMALAAIHGASIVAASAIWDAALQRNVPKELLGRVASVDQFSSILLAPLAPLIIGVLMFDHGAAPVFILGGVFTALLSGAALGFPSVRALR